MIPANNYCPLKPLEVDLDNFQFIWFRANFKSIHLFYTQITAFSVCHILLTIHSKPVQI